MSFSHMLFHLIKTVFVYFRNFAYRTWKEAWEETE